MDRRYLLGVDPGKSSTGLCLYDPKTQSIMLGGGDLFDAIAWVNKNVDLGRTIAVVENPALTPVLFNAWPRMEAAIRRFAQRKCGIGEVKSVYSSATSQSMRVGKNQETAELLIRLFKRQRVPVVEINPKDRDKAPHAKAKEQEKRGRARKQKRIQAATGNIKMYTMPTKTTAAEFAELTSYNGTSNHDQRDAATIVWGKTAKWAEMMLRRQGSDIHEAAIEGEKQYILDRKKPQ